MGTISNIDIGATNITTLGTITTGTWDATIISPTYGGTGVNNGASTITIGGSHVLSGAYTSTFTLTGNTNVTFPTSGTLITSATADVIDVSGTTDRITASPTTGHVVIDISASYVGQSSITTLGTIGAGVWGGTLVSPTYGGTGLSNPAAHGILIGEGSAAITPLVLTDGQILVGVTGSDPAKTAMNSGNGILVANGSGTITVNIANNPTIPGTAGITLPAGNTAARAGAAGTIRFNSQTGVFESTVDGLTWATIETSAIGVVSITGTANEISASASTGSITLSIPSAFIAPGTISVGNLELNTQTLSSTNSNGNINLTPNGSGINVLANAQVTSLTASTALASDGSKNIVSSSTTATELGYVHGVTSAIQTQLNAITGGIVTSVSGDSSTILVTPTTGNAVVSILSTYVGQSSITTLGTIGTGVWAGTNVALNHGGSNAALTASNGGIIYSTASAMAILAGTATANQALLSGSSTSPVWSTATYPSSTTINQLLYSSSNNVITGLATAAAGVLTTVSSVPTWSSDLSVPLGGTGVASFAEGQPICGGVTTTGALQQVSTSGAVAGQVLTYVSSTALPTWQAGGSGSGSAVTMSISQAAHGFSVGNVVYYTGTAYALAEATTVTLAEALGVVSTVTDANDFIITTSGYIPSAAGITGLTAGQNWLSDATAGLLTATQPTTVGHIQKPILFADSTSSGYVINYRGEIIPTTISYPLTVANGGQGNTSLTAYAVLTGGTTSTGAVQSLASVGTAGQALLSNGAGALPTFTTIYQGYAPVDQTTTPQTVASNNAYICDDGATQIVYNLPATAALGFHIKVIGGAAGGWVIHAYAGQTIIDGQYTSTSGGSLTSKTANDSVELYCIVASTTWIVTAGEGAYVTA